MKKLSKITAAMAVLALMLCALAVPASADTALTVLNDCSDPSQFTASPGMIFGANTESPDGKALEIEYEYALTFNLKSNVAKDQREADADKEYLCFWIKTPYSECDSGIFIGLIEDGPAEGSVRNMLWNGSENAGYSGNIITVDKNGNKTYTKADRLLVLKPGFEGYVAIPMKTAMGLHPGWGSNSDGIFDFSIIDEIQIWFDGSHAAYDEKYAFDNFTLAADENAFISMVTATGLEIKDAAAQTPASSEESTGAAGNEQTSNDASADNSQNVTSGNAGTTGTGNTVSTQNGGSGSNTLAFVVVAAVVVLGLAAALIFIYKPKFIFKEKASAAEVAEEAPTDKTEE